MSGQQQEIPKLGDIFSVSLNTRYQADPVEVLRCLADSSREHILLESAEINSRTNLKKFVIGRPPHYELSVAVIKSTSVRVQPMAKF